MRAAGWKNPPGPPCQGEGRGRSRRTPGRRRRRTTRNWPRSPGGSSVRAGGGGGAPPAPAGESPPGPRWRGREALLVEVVNPVAASAGGGGEDRPAALVGESGAQVFFPGFAFQARRLVDDHAVEADGDEALGSVAAAELDERAVQERPGAGALFRGSDRGAGQVVTPGALGGEEDRIGRADAPVVPGAADGGADEFVDRAHGLAGAAAGAPQGGGAGRGRGPPAG